MAKILVVDDEEQIRQMLVDMLEMDGYQVEVAPDGLSAIDRLDDSIDVLLTDIIMPNNGYDLIAHVKSNMPSLPIIVMSGGGSLNGVTTPLDKDRLGVFGVVHKPFRSVDLKALLDDLMLSKI